MFCDCPTENTERNHVTDCSSSIGLVYGIRSSVLLPSSKKKHRISYNSYVKGIYHGTIWADKYIIGALSRMLNIKITVISPYYSDVWNVFHRSTIPDVVIVSHGRDFGAKNPVTHFTATCGTENIWRCVGSDIAVGEIGHYSKESKGRTYAINVFEAEEKTKMTIKAQKITMDIDELSKDLKEICI